MTFAWLAPELPSVSGTFVFREVDALRRDGYPVATWSLHRPTRNGLAADGAAHLATTGVVYDGALSVAGRAAAFALRHPLRAARTLGTALRDTARGRFAKRSARWKVPLQAVAGLALARDLRRDGTRHLHVHFCHAPANVGMYAARAAGIPFSVTAHANDLFVEASLLEEKVRRAAAFVTISDANRSHLVDRIGPLGTAVRVVRCGVDAAAFGARRRAPRPRFVVASVGRLVPKKGFDVLLRAFATVAAIESRATLAIAGDGPEKERLVALTKELGLEGRVRFLGTTDREGVRRLLDDAGVFALACREDGTGDRDGIPVALMEAMGTGVPCVSTRVPGIPELVRHGDTGLLVEPGDPWGLADALLRILRNPVLGEALAAAGMRHVRRAFDQRTNASRLADVLRLSRRGPLSQAATFPGPARSVLPRPSVAPCDGGTRCP